MSLNDTTDEPAIKLCECGCGRPTPLAKKTHTKNGWIKGQPLHRIRGHSTRVRDTLENPNPSGLCMCGCGQSTALATLTSVKHGRVEGFPVRYIRGHSGRVDVIARFWAHVEKSPEPDGCWLWTGAKTGGEYGVFNPGGRQGHKTTAHRFSYELHYGPLSGDQDACHECDNPPCIRPDHLFAGTRKVNMQDAKSKGRTRNGTTKLTETQVLEIRRRHALEGVSQASLAREYNVRPNTISRIVNHLRWQNI